MQTSLSAKGPFFYPAFLLTSRKESKKLSNLFAHHHSIQNSMAKIRIEVCIISARGLGRSPSLLKPQWFAVGWIDSNSKYCTKINSSGNLNPTWKTMFSFDIDDRSSNLLELSLNVEIYKREPIFLREKLHGTATIMLKEFLAKFSREENAFKPILEETGSFQLRKQNSGRPQGFVDISLHITEEREDVPSNPGRKGGFQNTDQANGITLAFEDRPVVSYPSISLTQPQPQFEDYPQTTYIYPYLRQPLQLTSWNRRPPPAQPPPQPPLNAAYLPTLFPGHTNRPLGSYINFPPSRNVGQRLRAGALATGTVIFGDDLISGVSFPTGLDGGSLIVTTDPSF